MLMNMRFVRKFFVALVGGVVILAGLVLIPTPAPEGWLILIAGVAILSTEFSFAKRLMQRIRRIRQKFTNWLHQQPKFLQTILNTAGLLMLIGVVVLAVWLTVRAFS